MLKEIEALIARDGFWDNPEQTKGILKEQALLSDQVENFRPAGEGTGSCEVLLDLGLEESDAAI